MADAIAFADSIACPLDRIEERQAAEWDPLRGRTRSVTVWAVPIASPSN